MALRWVLVDDGVYPVLGVKVEPDRARARASLSPLEAFGEVWQVFEFAVMDFPDDDDELNAEWQRSCPSEVRNDNDFDAAEHTPLALVVAEGGAPPLCSAITRGS